MSADEHRIQFGTLSPEGFEPGPRIRQSSIQACRFGIMDPAHYRSDETCKCDDPDERARMIREWDYTAADFAGIPLREDAP